MALELSSTAAQGQLWIADGIGHVRFAEQIGAPYFERMARFWNTALAGAQTPEKRLRREQNR